MKACPDTSYLCALYRSQDNSTAAIRHFRSLAEPLHVSGLLLFEFRQSIRFQVWLHSQDKTKGYAEREAVQMLADLDSDVAAGALVTSPADWSAVHQTAERLSAKHTKSSGCRAFDLLHVAVGLTWEVSEFLSFDSRQRVIAAAEGLKVRP